jgi:hypothetical protein
MSGFVGDFSRFGYVTKKRAANAARTKAGG